MDDNTCYCRVHYYPKFGQKKKKRNLNISVLCTFVSNLQIRFYKYFAALPLYLLKRNCGYGRCSAPEYL
jgi:hypothetical protein